jgi:hypothetical protein
MNAGFAISTDALGKRSERPSDRLGRPVPQTLDALHSCVRAIGASTKEVDPSCLTRLGMGYNHAVYQPAGRFWLFQSIETALFGGTAVVLILFAAWWVHERVS